MYIHSSSAILCFIGRQTTNIAFHSMKLNVSYFYFFLPSKTHASTYISTRWAPSSRRIHILSTFSMLYSGSSQNFGSTSPLLSRYTSRQKAKRMCIRRTIGRRCRNPDSDRSRAWRTYTIYASADCPVNAASVTVENMPTTNAYLSAYHLRTENDT